MIIRPARITTAHRRGSPSQRETGAASSRIAPPWTQPIPSMAMVGGREFDTSAPGTVTMLTG